MVSQVQRSEGPAADLSRDRCRSVSERRAGVPAPPPFQVFRNSSAPDLAAMLRSSAGDTAALKPVPKPRTVFNRRRTVPVHFCPEPRRVSQDEDGPSAEDRPGRSWSLSAPGPLSPPVPPRTSAGLCPSVEPDGPSSLPEQTPSCAGSHGNSRSPGLSPSGSPRASQMEMVSNDIYWGTLAAPATPPRRGADLQGSRWVTPALEAPPLADGAPLSACRARTFSSRSTGSAPGEFPMGGGQLRPPGAPSGSPRVQQVKIGRSRAGERASLESS